MAARAPGSDRDGATICNRAGLRFVGPPKQKGSRMLASRVAVSLLAALLPAALAGLALPAHAAGKTDRYGIEGKIVSYDAAADTFTIKVTNAGVSGGFGTGGTAGRSPPDDVKAGSETVMAVVPEGSALKRPATKAHQGSRPDTPALNARFTNA